MRIEFPNAARDDFHWAKAQLRVGSASDNDLVIGSSQAAPRHLDIQCDHRGWTLQVLPFADRIYVNARPVRERALLRAGDVVSVGDCRLLLRDDENPQARAPISMPAHGRCTVSLRAVSGPLSGRVFSLKDSLELGAPAGFPLELPRGESVGIKIFWRDGLLYLETTRPSSHHPVRVNGVVAASAELHPQDQIGVSMHRFVVEAPGMKPEPEWIRPAASPTGLPENAAGPSSEVWWLIATAAVLAFGIALALLIRF